MVLGFAYTFLAVAEICVFAIDVEPRARSPQVQSFTGDIGCIRDPDAGRLDVSTRTGVVLIAAFFVDFSCTMAAVIHFLRHRELQGRLSEIFVTQGLGAFTFMTLVHVLCASLAFSHSLPAGGGVVIPMSLTLSSTVACRLILMLRRWASPTETKLLRDHSRIVRNDLGEITFTQTSDEP
ncbi:hypothetical protein HGRIS_003717 [Hohenbuehelia grisea]|uniref:Transmembrane protein n=1 Tax=Hohenbuehelia grisea TaxID=104357 RepID=A0ABR3JGD0_9AGAR